MPSAGPTGKNRAATRPRVTICRVCDASTMQPSPGPECSSSMPSCSIVSSRWVSGLSTGMRPVSAGSSTSMAAKPRKSAACQARTHDVPRCAARAPSSVVPAATAVENTTIINTGSTSGAIVISREAPMPPNAPPASNAPIAVRKRAEEARGRVRLHRALAEQLREVAVRLKDPGALPALEPGLELLDGAGDEWPEQHQEDHLQKHELERSLGGHLGPTPNSSNATKRAPSTNPMYP